MNISTQHCWNQIGVGGDQSCPELETATHCRNCLVYQTAGRGLLERDLPLEYLAEQTAIVAESSQTKRSGEMLSAIVFRINQERFAFSVRLLHEVAPFQAIHRLPHRSNEMFLGLVNLHGEILLCAALNRLLSLDTSTPLDSTRRLIVVGQDQKWVFPVDEVLGIHRFALTEVEDVPIVLAKAQQTYTKGIIDWHSEKVNYLDAERLLNMLDRGL